MSAGTSQPGRPGRRVSSIYHILRPLHCRRGHQTKSEIPYGSQRQSRECFDGICSLHGPARHQDRDEVFMEAMLQGWGRHGCSLFDDCSDSGFRSGIRGESHINSRSSKVPTRSCRPGRSSESFLDFPRNILSITEHLTGFYGRTSRHSFRRFLPQNRKQGRASQHERLDICLHCSKTQQAYGRRQR